MAHITISPVIYIYIYGLQRYYIYITGNPDNMILETPKKNLKKNIVMGRSPDDIAGSARHRGRRPPNGSGKTMMDGGDHAGPFF